jgi:hypothetical protein
MAHHRLERQILSKRAQELVERGKREILRDDPVDQRGRVYAGGVVEEERRRAYCSGLFHPLLDRPHSISFWAKTYSRTLEATYESGPSSNLPCIILRLCVALLWHVIWFPALHISFPWSFWWDDSKYGRIQPLSKSSFSTLRYIFIFFRVSPGVVMGLVVLFFSFLGDVFIRRYLAGFAIPVNVFCHHHRSILETILDTVDVHFAVCF